MFPSLFKLLVLFAVSSGRRCALELRLSSVTVVAG